MAESTLDQLTVACLQHRCSESQNDNRERLAELIEQAASSGAQLVLLQELYNTPYFCQTEDVSHFDLAETIPGPSTDWLAELAARHDLVIVGSLFERRAGGLYHNTAVVLDGARGLVGRYRKMHIPDDPGFHEKFYFTPGDLGFEPINTRVGRLGVLVCWDQWFPEAARLMAMRGAELLLYPTAIGWDDSDSDAEQQRQLDAWQLVQRSHAVTNGLPILVSNRPGHEPGPGTGIRFWGHSFVAGPQGELLAEASCDEDEALLATLDRGRSETVRRIWPFFRDRRIDAYGRLTRRWDDEAS